MFSTACNILRSGTTTWRVLCDVVQYTTAAHTYGALAVAYCCVAALRPLVSCWIGYLIRLIWAIWVIGGYEKSPGDRAFVWGERDDYMFMPPSTWMT